MPFIYSHNPLSQGAKALSRALGIKRIKHKRSRFTGKRNPIVINWGATELPDWDYNVRLINHYSAVDNVSNKLDFFLTVDENNSNLIPPFTPYPEVAKDWLKVGHVVVCRHTLYGSGGVGIEIVEGDADIPHAPLYTQYKKKKDEYRVHIMNGEVIDVQEKARAYNRENIDWRVRNHHNGFIYRREGIDPPKAVLTVSLVVWKCFDLDFGAVDIIWNNKEKRAYALEINTAPGLAGQTVLSYTKGFQKWLKGK